MMGLLLMIMHAFSLMDEKAFQETVVGNTVVGITRQSHSLYKLYFLPRGECILWKQEKTYTGRWWFEGEHVRAFWPDYHSSEPKSLFSPENPRYGTPTALRYYYNPETNGLILAGKSFQASALLIPGRSFE